MPEGRHDRPTPSAEVPEETILQPAGGAADRGAAPAAEPEAGLFGRFRLLERLGGGGMGVVYRGLHVKLQKTVALKVLTAERTADPQAVARFLREISLVSRLSHRNIVRFENTGEADGRHYLVMEYVPGADLARLVETLGPLPVADACQLACQAAVGLEHIGRAGLVHRDIKPSNLILASDGTLKIVDLGLARLCEGLEELTLPGQKLGTAAYSAPEQSGGGGAIDIRADVYSLGCTLFHLLTGRPPFHGPQYESPRDMLLAHSGARPPSLRSLREGVPAGLSALLARMLAKQPGERPQTPAEAARLLLPYAEGCRVAALLERLSIAPAAETASHGSSADTVAYLTAALSSTQVGEAPVASAGSETESAAETPARSGHSPRRIAMAAMLGAAAIAAVCFGIYAFLDSDPTNVVATGGTGTAERPPAAPPRADFVELDWGAVEWLPARVDSRTFSFDDLQVEISLAGDLTFDAAQDSPNDSRPDAASSAEQSLHLAWTWPDPASKATVEMVFSQPVESLSLPVGGLTEAEARGARLLNVLAFHGERSVPATLSVGEAGVMKITSTEPLTRLTLEFSWNQKPKESDLFEVRLHDATFTVAKPFGATYVLDWDQLDWRPRSHAATVAGRKLTLSLSGDGVLGGLPAVVPEKSALAWRVLRKSPAETIAATLDFDAAVADLHFDLSEIDGPGDNFADALTAIGLRDGRPVYPTVAWNDGPPRLAAGGVLRAPAEAVASAGNAPGDRARLRFPSPVERVMLVYRGELPADVESFIAPRQQQVLLHKLRFRPVAGEEPMQDSSTGVSPSGGGHTVIVPATAHPWLAGLPGEAALGADRAPGESPVELRLPLVAGSAVEFRASGQIRLQPGPLWRGPDGGALGGRPAEAEVQAASLPRGALVGVFLGEVPAEDAAWFGAGSPVVDDAALDVAPGLGVVFRIGGGLGVDGDTVRPRQVFVPPGARRLLLGVMDDGDYHDNVGHYEVQVAVVPPGESRLILSVDEPGREVTVNGVPQALPAGSKTIRVAGGRNTVRFPDGGALDIRAIVAPIGGEVSVSDTPPSIDALPRIVLERDAIRGQATRDEDGLLWASPADTGALLQLPLHPPAEYTLEVEVERTQEGGSFGIGLPLVGGACLIVFDVERSGEAGGGLLTAAGESTELVSAWPGEALPVGQSTTLAVRFAGDSLTVSAGGRTLLERQGELATLAPPMAAAAMYAGVPYLHNRGGAFRIRELRLTPLSGVVRPVPLSAKASPERLLAERVLWRGGKVTVGEYGQLSPAITRLEDLPPAPRLVRIDPVDTSRGVALTNEHLRLAAGADRLAQLDLRNSLVTDAGLPHLRGLSRLDTLYLMHTQVTGAGFAELGQTVRLRVAGLSSTPLDDVGLAALAPALSEATWLCVCSTNVTAASVPVFAQLSKLTTLHLGNDAVTDADLEKLAEIVNLKELRVVGTQVTPEGLAKFQELRPDVTLLD